MKNYIKTIKYLILASFASLVFFAFSQNTFAAGSLSISCSGNPESITVGSSVRWRASVSGSTEYRYSWTGTDRLSGSHSTVTKTYSSTGIKTAILTVRSGDFNCLRCLQTATTSCSINVVDVPPPPPPPTLIVSCSANPGSVLVGGSINWTSNVSGGTGTYTRSWTGTDGLFGSASTVSKTYSSAGIKNASISVTSGTQTVTAHCPATVTTVPPPPSQGLVVSCYPNVGSVLVGSQIGWLSSVSGGNGAYSYSWTGTDGLSGSSNSVQKTYSSTGIKTASLTVSSNNQSATANCVGSVNVYQNQVQNTHNNSYNYYSGSCSTLDTSGCVPPYNYNYYNNNYSQLSGSCSAGVSNTTVGGTVSWTANASGGNGFYTYYWNGDDGVSSNGQYVSKTYYSPGVKNINLTIISDNQTITRTCSVNVVAPVNQVLSYVQTSKVPLTASVLLSDIPYTGAGDLAKIISFVFGVILWSLFIAYLIWRKKSTKIQKVVVSGVEISEAPKDNGTKKIEVFSKNIELEKQVIESVEDYARSNRVILSSDASIAIVKLAKLGKINAPELIRKMSQSDWTSIGEKDIERYI
jgi:hypothetical protein